ncbi:MAG: GDSL-type esterase/lipase family protein [Bacteroidota bacterium]
MRCLFGKVPILLLLVILPYGCSPSGDTPIPTRILMLGDSITAGGHWNQLTGRADIRNEGLGGATSKSTLNRFDREVWPPEISHCFLMIGANDISGRIPVDQVVDNIELILDGLASRNIEVILQSVLFVATDLADHVGRNMQIKTLNEKLMVIADERELTFLDLNEILAPEGYLLDRYTQDGIHLMEDGYRLWVSQVLPIIDSYGI